MSKKKVTAPLSYDPGKGRPKEYLAYLNWQEMQELMRINGNNVERGPRGLPSFPPDDAIGSGQTPGTGNWTGSPGSGTTSGGAGGTTGGGSDSGNVGGSVGGTTTSAASTSSAGSQQASNDTEAQQAAAQQNAAEAARNEALRQDAARSGINSINVGPMQNPVKIGGGQIFGSLSSMAQQVTAPTSGSIPTGFMSPQQQMIDRQNTMYSPRALSDLYKGIGAFGVEDPAKRSRIQESLLGQTIELSKTGKTLGYKAAPNVKYSGALDPFESGVVMHWTGSPTTKVPALGIGKGYGYGVVVDPRGNVSYTKPFTSEGNFPQTWHAAGFNEGRIGIANIGVEPNQEQVEAAAALGRDWFNPEAQVTSHGYLAGDIAAQRRAAGQKFSPRQPAEGKALASAFSGGLGSPSLSINSQFASVAPPSMSPINAVPASVEFADVENAYNPGVVAGATIPTVKPYQDRLVTIDGFTQEVGPESFAMMDPVDRARIDALQQAQVYDPNFMGPLGGIQTAEGDIQNVEDQYRQPVGVSASVIPSEYNYPLKPDGTPYTAEDIANFPPEVRKAQLERTLHKRMGRVPYNLTEEQKQKIAVAEGVGRVMNYSPITRGFTGITKLVGAGLGALPGAFKEFGEGLSDAARQIRDPGAAVEAWETATPIMQSQIAERAGKPNQIPGIAPDYTGTTYAGGTPTQEPGSKGNEFRQFASYTPQYTPGPAGQTSTRDGERSQQYYLWDLGVGIPSPGDPDYNDYQKYLRERGTSAAV